MDVGQNSLISAVSLNTQKKHETRKSDMFTCNKCGKSFQHKSTLAICMTTHSNKKPFACDKCQRKYKKKNERDCYCGVEHTHACDEDNCTYTFTDPKLYNEHKQTKHGKRKLFKSPLCPKLFRYR